MAFSVLYNTIHLIAPSWHEVGSSNMLSVDAKITKGFSYSVASCLTPFSGNVCPRNRMYFCPQKENATTLLEFSAFLSVAVHDPFPKRMSQGAPSFIVVLWWIKIKSCLYLTLGLIIDAFGELRDQQEQVKEDMEVGLPVADSACLLLQMLLVLTAFYPRIMNVGERGKAMNNVCPRCPVFNSGSTSEQALLLGCVVGSMSL